MEELYAKMYELETASVGNRHVWLYEIDTAIGHIYVVEWEEKSLEIHEKMFREDREKAKRCYQQTVSRIALGKM